MCRALREEYWQRNSSQFFYQKQKCLQFFFVYWDCNLHDLDTRSFLTTYFIVTATSGAGSGPGGGDARRGGDVTPHAQPQRRLIKVDFDNLEVITPSHSPVPFFLRG